MVGRVKEPKMVRPSRRRKAEYVARGMRVRPMERAVLGRVVSVLDEDGDGEGDGDADADVDAEDGADADAGEDWEGADVGVGAGVGVAVIDGEGGALFLWPNSWANFTSFQMPTEELTTKVEAKVVMPAIAWSILG
jgi:hypothetical protein